MKHADEGRVEVGGSNFDQGQEEGEGREARRRRVFVEGRKDNVRNTDCGGSAQEESNAKEEGSVEEGGAFRTKGLLCNSQAPTSSSATNAWQRFRNNFNYY